MIGYTIPIAKFPRIFSAKIPGCIKCKCTPKVRQGICVVCPLHKLALHQSNQIQECKQTLGIFSNGKKNLVHTKRLASDDKSNILQENPKQFVFSQGIPLQFFTEIFAFVLLFALRARMLKSSIQWQTLSACIHCYSFRCCCCFYIPCIGDDATLFKATCLEC